MFIGGCVCLGEGCLFCSLCGESIYKKTFLTKKKLLIWTKIAVSSTLKRNKRSVAMVATSTLNSKNAECISELIDRRYDQACLENELDFWDHCLAEPHLNVEVSEDGTCQQLAKMFENCLSRSKKTTLHCSKVLVPEKLTMRMARDVLRLSSGEPCGLRGCVLYIHLEQETCCKQLERIVYNADVVPIFELTLVFKQDCSAWPSLRDFLHIGACFTSGFRHALKLSPGFRLIKKKLYSSSAGTVVEEY